MIQLPSFCNVAPVTTGSSSTPLFGHSKLSEAKVGWMSPKSIRICPRTRPVHRPGQPWEASLNGVDVATDRHTKVTTYKTWLAERVKQSSMTSAVAIGAASLTEAGESDGGAGEPQAPSYPHGSLCHEGAETYAYGMTSHMGETFDIIVSETSRNPDLFAPAMIGRLVGQFLKMITQLMKPERVLDIGTFTGCSALAFAQGGAKQVVTLEADPNTAQVARTIFSQVDPDISRRIQLVETDATEEVQRMMERGERFDVVCMDADKIHYKHYYQCAIQLLNVGGIVVADNALGSLIFNDGDINKQAMHEFSQYVRDDSRVEQVMLTIREGLLIARKVSE